jgi:integrase
MAGQRKKPKLRIDGVYYTTKIYTPEGKRTTLSFGHVDDRPEADVRAVFAKWVELFELHPKKLLSYDNPYEGVKHIVSPSTVGKVGELMQRYLQWATNTLRKTRDGLDSPDLPKICRAIKFLEPYSYWPIDDLGPDELRAVQKALLESEYKANKTKKRYTRRGVNDTINCIRTAWRWGFGRGLVKIEKVELLKEVKQLKTGQDNVHENHRREIVTEEEFNKVLAKANPVVIDMLRLIWLTAMRPYEVCDIRPYDILTDDKECWLYIPGRDKSPIGDHKTARFGRIKVIPLTRAAQEVLKPRIKDFASKDYVFKPREAVKDLEHLIVKTREKYDHNTLCRACKRACERAKVKEFVPYDLRRTVATGTRALLGKEAAKVLLGHAKTDTTDIYLLEEVQEAIKVAKMLASKT